MLMILQRKVLMKFQTYPFEKLQALLKDIAPNSALTPLSLTIGEPQFQTPVFIQEALGAHAHLLNKYPKSAGEAVLKEAMIGFVKRRFAIVLNQEEIIPTFGTRELLFNFPQSLLFEKKAPVMAFPNPFYQIYEGAAIASRAKVHYLPLTKANGFKPPIDERTLQECDLVILNSPNNPTASVMSLEELKEWAMLALKYNFVLLNDECYSEIYTDVAPPSLLNAAYAIGNKAFKNIVVINSISKRSSAPGLRSGFIAGDKTLLRSYMRYRTYVGCASPLPLQMAAAKAWSDDAHVKVFKEAYRKNFAMAKQIIGTAIPKATFYIWLEVDDEIAFTKRTYKEQNLRVLPGSFLGREGEGRGYVRLALVYNEQLMQEALARIKSVLG